MSIKKITIQLDIDETLYNIVTIHSKLNRITIDEACIDFLNRGMASGALDCNDAIEKGAILQKTTVEIIADVNRLKNIANMPTASPEEISKNLLPNLRMSYGENNEEMVKRLTDEANERIAAKKRGEILSDDTDWLEMRQ